jgi:hypothetical protein
LNFALASARLFIKATLRFNLAFNCAAGNIVEIESTGKKKSTKAFRKSPSHRVDLSPLDADCATKFAFNFPAVSPASKKKKRKKK